MQNSPHPGALAGWGFDNETLHKKKLNLYIDPANPNPSTFIEMYYSFIGSICRTSFIELLYLVTFGFQNSGFSVRSRNSEGNQINCSSRRSYTPVQLTIRVWEFRIQYLVIAIASPSTDIQRVVCAMQVLPISFFMNPRHHSNF